MGGAVEVVRAGRATQRAQQLAYAPGVTSATTSTGALCLTGAVLPVGARSACHLHHSIESAGYVVSGRVETWWGDALEGHAVLEAGDFAYIPADLPHVVGNAGDEPAAVVVAHGSASDQDGIELLPELDVLLERRGS